MRTRAVYPLVLHTQYFLLERSNVCCTDFEFEVTISVSSQTVGHSRNFPLQQYVIVCVFGLVCCICRIYMYISCMYVYSFQVIVIYEYIYMYNMCNTAAVAFGAVGLVAQVVWFGSV